MRGHLACRLVYPPVEHFCVNVESKYDTCQIISLVQMFKEVANTMHYPDISDSSAIQITYQRLRDMIVKGDLQPGEKLKIEPLRKMLNTGASPIREALSLLTSDMLVERFDQRGFRAAPVSKSSFDEILMLRCTLEDMALRTSIEKASEDWEERLVLAHHHMSKLSRTGSSDFENAHKTFHMLLLQNSELPTLLRYCEQLYDLNIRYRYLAAGGAGYENRCIATEHKQIFEAALDRDVESASKFLLAHYHRTGVYLISLMSGD